MSCNPNSVNDFFKKMAQFMPTNQWNTPDTEALQQQCNKIGERATKMMMTASDNAQALVRRQIEIAQQQSQHAMQASQSCSQSDSIETWMERQSNYLKDASKQAIHQATEMVDVFQKAQTEFFHLLKDQTIETMNDVSDQWKKMQPRAAQ
jgi:phasin family protein